jgi:hypothetical protein
MSEATQLKKRERAARIPAEHPLAGEPHPAYGPLDVEFGSPFDCICYIATIDNLAVKKPAKYARIVEYLATETGCTVDEVEAHGQKVRATLWFALDRLQRGGEAVARKLKYPLPSVRPAF